MAVTQWFAPLEVSSACLADPERLLMLQDKQVYDFPILLDANAEVIRRYGVFNDADKKGRALPHPTTVLVDRTGVIRWLHTDPNYRQRPPIADVVTALEAITDE